MKNFVTFFLFGREKQLTDFTMQKKTEIKNTIKHYAI